MGDMKMNVLYVWRYYSYIVLLIFNWNCVCAIIEIESNKIKLNFNDFNC